MPGVLRIALEEMMPRLRAEEELNHASVIAAGTGNLDKREARKWVKDRRDAAAGKRRAQRARTWKEHFDLLRSRGLNVVVTGEEPAA